MTTRIKLRRDTAANWTAANPILAAGEPGLETDTSRVKYGDGTTAWTDLEYASGGSDGAASLTDTGNVVVTTGSTEHWIATQRKDGIDTVPKGLRYDSLGNLYALTQVGYQDRIAVITKYAATGSVAWQKSFTGYSAIALAVDSGDNAYITLDREGDEADVITIVKFSGTGSIAWQKEYDADTTAIFDAYIEEKSATTMAVAFSGATGEIPAPNINVVMEISSTDGSVLIQKQIAGPEEDILVYLTGIDVDSDENVFVTGYYSDGGEVNKMFIEKLDEDLDRVWTKSLETDTTYDMYGGDCASDAQGNIYAVGTYRVDTINTDDGPTSRSAAILVKLNVSGVVQWTRRIGPGPCGSFATGLTATDTGDVYLSSVTFAKKVDGEVAEYPEFVQEALGTNKLIVARYDSQGAVVWQRYVDVVNLYEQFDDEQVRGQAVAVFGDKFAVDGYGISGNTAPYAVGSTDDQEYDYFVTQLPTDGTALTIGNLEFTESRVPGRFITVTAEVNPLSISTFATGVSVSDAEVTADSDSRVANSKINSDTYDYVFGADGTLTIPNDGDVRLTQTQVGYFIAVGGSINNDDDIDGRATTVDSQGNMYVVGEEDDDSQPFVMKISPEGVRLWSVRIEEDADGDNGRANGVTVDPNNGHIMVVCEFYGNYTYSALITVDQDTGRIIDSTIFSDSDSDVYLNDIAYNSTGSYVLAGSKDSEFSDENPVTPLEGSTTGTLYISRSEVEGNPGSWQIGGTGITPFEDIAYVERYIGLTGTVQQGSDAEFTVTDNGDGTYSVSDPAGTGTNYRVDHRITILGTDLGGATPANDLDIQVGAVNETGGITSVFSYGTAAGIIPATYTAVTGTNQVGSGLVFTYEGPRNNTDYDYWNDYNITNGGANYVSNDVIVISGTSLGGVNGVNDLTVTVTGVNNGAVTGLTFSGTSQSTTWKLETTTQVDFADEEGAWSVTFPLSRENLLITPAWTRTFGTAGNEEDRLYAVAVDSNNNIIAVGQGRGDVDGDEEDLAMVYKFNSTGTLQWARKLNEISYDCYAKSVATIGTDIYVTHESDDDGETVVTKLDTTGTVKWQRRTDSGDDSVIAATADGNLLVTCEAYNSDIDEDALKVFLLNPNGEVVYKRWLHGTVDNNTQFKNGRCLAVDADSFYITAYFYANDYDSTMATRLPIDGTGTGEYGSFRYTDVNAETGGFFSPGLNGVNYFVDQINIEENSYAGPLAEGEQVYIKTTATVTTAPGEFYVNGFYTDLTVETVRDTDGGSIIFADGTRQSTSATDIPQRRFTGQQYTLGLKDRGHHILCQDSNNSIMIPYYARVEFPTGSVITIVNPNSDASIEIRVEGQSGEMMVVGQGFESYVWLEPYGMATILNLGRDQWAISGNVTTSNPNP